MAEFVLVFAILALLLGAYWTMVVFPKQRAFQHKQKIVRSLHVGEDIVTYGGIVGKIIDIDVERGLATVEIADGLCIKLLTAAIQRSYNADEFAYNAQIGQQQMPAAEPANAEGGSL